MDKSRGFQTPLDEIVWKAYESQDFFEELVKARNSRTKLLQIINDMNIEGVTDEDISKLIESLNRSRIEISAIDLMKMLHKFTTPKNLSLKGNDQWRVW